MKISEGYHYTNKKSASFNTQDRLDNKIDKLTSMMSKLITQGKTQQQDTQFKPPIYQRKRRGQMKCEYDQGKYQTRNRSNSGEKNDI